MLDFPYAKSIEKNLNKIKSDASTVKNIDCIYLINLDRRPEKLHRTLKQFAPYGIRPNRLPAIYGWTLPDDVFEDVGLKIQPGMLWKGSIIMRQSSSTPMKEPRYGMAAFYPRMTHGAVGTALSHLSVLQNAYDAGYQTIWVLEDDVSVKSDPRNLSNYIEKLDALVGSDGWDILYTDDVTYFEPFTPGTVWRPDMAGIDYDPLYERTDRGEDFFKIGGRCQAHSMIMRRSAVQKILEFEKSRGIYLPYDVEIAFVPNMRFFNLKHNVVIGGTLANSDTIHRYFA